MGFTLYLRLWGCVVYVLVPAQERSIFVPKTLTGMLTGYEPFRKVYGVYVGGKTWKVSRFGESMLVAAKVGMLWNDGQEGVVI